MPQHLSGAHGLSEQALKGCNRQIPCACHLREHLRSASFLSYSSKSFNSHCLGQAMPKGHDIIDDGLPADDHRRGFQYDILCEKSTEGWVTLIIEGNVFVEHLARELTAFPVEAKRT